TSLCQNFVWYAPVGFHRTFFLHISSYPHPNPFIKAFEFLFDITYSKVVGKSANGFIQFGNHLFKACALLSSGSVSYFIPNLSNSLLWKHHVILPEVKAQQTKAFVEMNNSCLLGMYRKFEIILKNFFSCLIGLFSLSLRFTENNRVFRKTYNRKSLLIQFSSRIHPDKCLPEVVK